MKNNKVPNGENLLHCQRDKTFENNGGMPQSIFLEWSHSDTVAGESQ